MKWLVAGILVVLCVIAIMIYSEQSRQAAERDKANYEECEQTFLKYSQDDSICDVYESSPYHNNPRKASEKPAQDEATSEKNCKILVKTFGQAAVNTEAEKDPTLKPCVKPLKKQTHEPKQ